MTDETETKSRKWLILVILAVVLCGGYFGVRGYTLANADDTVREASQLLKIGKFRDARDTVDWILYFDPNNPKALAVAATSAASEQKFAEAVELFERVPDSELSPDDLDSKAAAFLGNQQWHKAETLLASSLSGTLDKQSLNRTNRLVRLYVAELRYAEATALMDRYFRETSDNTFLMNLVELMATTPSPDAYIADLQTTDNAHLNQRSVKLALASAYALSGRLEDAESQYDQLQAAWPDDLQVQLAAAEFYLQANQNEAASKLIAAARNNTDAAYSSRLWFVAAKLAEATGDHPSALGDLDRAISLSVPQEAYMQMKARLLRRLNKSDEAQQVTSAATQLANQRQQLMRLFPDLDMLRSKPEVLTEVSTIVEQLGYPEQAKAWQKLAEQSAKMQ